MRKLIIKLEIEFYYQSCLCGQKYCDLQFCNMNTFFCLFRIESSISWIKLDLISLEILWRLYTGAINVVSCKWQNKQATITCRQDRCIAWNSPQFSIYFPIINSHFYLFPNAITIFSYFFINLITKLIYYITVKHDPYTIFFYCLKLTPLENHVSN